MSNVTVDRAVFEEYKSRVEESDPRYKLVLWHDIEGNLCTEVIVEPIVKISRNANKDEHVTTITSLEAARNVRQKLLSTKTTDRFARINHSLYLLDGIKGLDIEKY